MVLCYTTSHPEVRENMDIIDFIQAEIDPIDNIDIRNGYYMRDLINFKNFNFIPLNRASLPDTFVKSLGTFKLYKDNHLVEDLFEKKKHFDYQQIGDMPFHFGIQMLVGEHNQVCPTIILPRNLDEASYAFLGHEFNHALKDINLDERRIRDRVAEVIPMFYEMLCSEYEPKEDVSKEIKKRRLALLQLDKDNESEDARQLQYFNSFYYALALYNMYRKDENKALILRLMTRVLKKEISTLDLLEMLDIYGMDLDRKVSWELEMMKEYIRK